MGTNNPFMFYGTFGKRKTILLVPGMLDMAGGSLKKFPKFQKKLDKQSLLFNKFNSIKKPRPLLASALKEGE